MRFTMHFLLKNNKFSIDKINGFGVCMCSRLGVSEGLGSVIWGSLGNPWGIILVVGVPGGPWEFLVVPGSNRTHAAKRQHSEEGEHTRQQASI